MFTVRPDLKPTVRKSSFRPYVKTDEDGRITQLFTGYIRKLRRYTSDGDEMQLWFNGWENVAQEGYKQVDNFVFEAVLIPQNSYRGRSAAGLMFTIPGMERAMEMTVGGVADMMERLVTKGSERTLEKGGVFGLWTLKKGGSNVHLLPWRSQ